MSWSGSDQVAVLSFSDEIDTVIAINYNDRYGDTSVLIHMDILWWLIHFCENLRNEVNCLPSKILLNYQTTSSSGRQYLNQTATVGSMASYPVQKTQSLLL